MIIRLTMVSFLKKRDLNHSYLRGGGGVVTWVWCVLLLECSQSLSSKLHAASSSIKPKQIV